MERPNPFENNVVFDPREAERAVPELNERALAILLRRFARLEAEPHPRRYRMNVKAQLILSPEPGYGKSHLIGRLFQALRGHASLIYLRPFQEPGSAWRSILEKLVQEMDRPDDPSISVRRSMRPTQLDTFVEGAFGHLLAELMEKDVVGGDYDPSLVRKLREDPSSAFGREEDETVLGEWMREQGDFLLSLFAEELSTADIALNTPASTWLSVLHAYCFGDGGKEKREACLEWLKGERGWPKEDLPPNRTEAARNTAAFGRLQDFFVLAGLSKPFVLCFDQLELLMGNPELVAEFGMVVDELVTFGLNEMVVVAANIEPWRTVMEKNFQPAFRDRFSDPITLKEIRQPQALELARRRLTNAGMGEEEIARFCNSGWLDSLFNGEQRLGARDFLRLCEKRA